MGLNQLSQIVMAAGSVWIGNALWYAEKYKRQHKKVQPFLDQCRKEMEYCSSRIAVIDEFRGKLNEESKNQYADELIDLKLEEKNLKKSISKIEEKLDDLDLECSSKLAFPVLSHIFFYLKGKRQKESMYHIEDNPSYTETRAANRN